MNTEKVRLVTDPKQLEALRRAHEEGERRRAFWDLHRPRLQALHPDEYVAATEDGDVIVHSPSFAYVGGFLEGRGINPREIYLEFLATGKQRLIL